MSASTEQSVVQVLREAAALIERDGWCQHSYFVGQAHCAVGAIRRVATKYDDWEVGDRAIDILSKTVHGRVLAWNDAHARRQADVISTLRTAADLAERAIPA